MAQDKTVVQHKSQCIMVKAAGVDNDMYAATGATEKWLCRQKYDKRDATSSSVKLASQPPLSAL